MKNLLILLYCSSLIYSNVNAQNSDCHPERNHCTMFNDYHKTEHNNKITYIGETAMDATTAGQVRSVEMCFPEFSKLDTIIAIRLYSTTNPHVKFKIIETKVNQGIYEGKTQVAIDAQNVNSQVPVDDCIVLKYRLVVTK
jgi:hypothetical protein